MSKKNTTTAVETQAESPTAKYDGLPTTSAKIRAMTADGMTRSQIAKALNIRYQHVRNVLQAPTKRPAA
jgi:DNA invertase Pin-like site-specific DNA recombinase